MAGAGPRGRQLFHQPLERYVLVSQGAQRRPADPAEHLGEGGVAREVGAQHQGVDEEADQVVGGLFGAARHGAADRDVLAGAQPGEQDGERRLPHHEGGGPLGDGEFRQAGVQVGGRAQGHPAAFAARHGGTRPVGGQGQFLGAALQRVPPVGDLAGEDAVGLGAVTEEVALPQGVVGVLHGQRFPVGGAAGPAGGVGGGQVAQQRDHRPAVGDDVVRDQDQHRLVGVGPVHIEEGGPHGRSGGEVEDVAGDLADPGFQFPAAHGLDGEVRGEVVEGDDVLVGVAVGVQEPGAQTLVPGEQVGPGRLECAGV